MIIETATTMHAARARRHPVLMAAAFLYLACVLGVWLAMRLLGDRHWVGTVLLLSPRWVLAVPLVILWPWALVRRSWRAGVVLAGASACLLWLVLGVVFSMPRGGDGRSDVRLLTCNIHRQNLDAERMSAFLEEVKPDIVTFQGWSDVHREQLFQDGWEVRRVGELLVASRFPIRSEAPLVFEDDPSIPGGEKGAAAVFDVQTPRGELRLISLHLASPHMGLNTMRSDRGRKIGANIGRRGCEASEVGRAAAEVRGPLLIAGDFNTVCESPIFREQLGELADAFEARGLGLGYTYVIRTTQIRIDHVLGNGSVRFERCWVGPDVGAAHRPLVADVSIR